MVQLIHRCGGPAGTDVRIDQAELRTPVAMVVCSRLRGVTLDESEARNPCRRSERWRDLRIVLRGRVRAKGGGQPLLRAGDMILAERWRGSALRSLDRETELLRVAWRVDGPLDGGVARAVRGRLGAADLDRMRDAGRRMMQPGEHQRQLAPWLLQRLAGLEMPLRPSGWPLRSSTVERRVAGAIEEVLTPFSSAPAAIDLARALGCGERQALRLTNRYLKEMHVTVRSWRQYLVGTRVALAMLALTHPKARTCAIATWLGLSATSLCHAFSALGLPAPRVFAARLLNGPSASARDAA